MALSRPTLNTPSYTRQRLRIEFINTYCNEQEKTLTELRRCIGTKQTIAECKGYWDIYFQEYVNKNMLPRSVDLSKVKIRNNNIFGTPTILLDLRNGKFIKEIVICLKNVLSTKSNEAQIRHNIQITNPTHGQEEALPAFLDVNRSNDEIQAPIQAAYNPNIDARSILEQAIGGIDLYVGSSVVNEFITSITLFTLLEMSNPQNPKFSAHGKYNLVQNVFNTFQESPRKLNNPSLTSETTSISSFSEHIAVNSQSKVLTTQRQYSEHSIQTSLASHARCPDYTELQARLDTFSHRNGEVNWPHDIRFQDAALLAKHGFFFAGRVDLCRCYLCGLGLNDWSVNDDVLFVHLKYSPNCKHLTETVDSNILSVYRRNIQQTTQCNSHALTEPGSANTINHPTYQGYTERLASFKNWSPVLVQTPGMLAEAGFFHTGLRDIVRCFACNGGLKQWDAGDQPWVEHARWFPFCKHVRREKGDEYIRLVQTAAETQVYEETNEREISSDSSFPIHYTATSSMGLGYSQAAVSMAIDECKTNNVSLTADNPTNILLDKEEKCKLLPTDSQRPESPTAPEFNKCKSYALTEHCAANTIKHPEYQGYTVSLSTSKTWPFDHVQTPGMLADAEMFYTGVTLDILREENQNLKEKMMCTVCHHRERSILFLPCRHRLTCIGCSDNVTECQNCLKTIVNKQKINIS